MNRFPLVMSLWRMLFESDQPVAGSDGRMTLWANDRLIGGEMPKTVPLVFTFYAGMDISRDNGLVVDREHEDKAPYAFTGTVKEVSCDPKPVSHEAEKALHEHGISPSCRTGCCGLSWRLVRASDGLQITLQIRKT